MPDCHRAAIPRNVERDLWARSGGYCARPECRADLLPRPDEGIPVPVGEMAHMIAWSPNGPRGGDLGVDEDPDRPENLLLLCPTCHALVDRAPSSFPVERLLEWKDEREGAVRHASGVMRMDDRAALNAEISHLLEQNRAIHEAYGPESPAAEDPISDAATTWRRELRRVILPNNRRVIELIRANRHLLDDRERDVAARFQVHADALSYNHQSGDKDPSAPRFPSEMNEIFSSP
jgi:hypothetical protein